MMRGVQRTVAIFDCFSAQRMALSLQEISEAIGLAKSTTFRIVQSLEQVGYLIRLEDQKYCLSFRFTRLAGMVMSTLNIRQIARPLMSELARLTSETITLNIVGGRERTCIDVIDTPAPLMSLARPGQHVPLDHKGATAKVLMASLPANARESLVARIAKAAGRDPARISSELARIARDGYCVSHGERVDGLSAIAAVVWDGGGKGDHCITITAPTVRLKPRVDEFVRLLCDAAREISLRLGAEGARSETAPSSMTQRPSPGRRRPRTATGRPANPRRGRAARPR